MVKVRDWIMFSFRVRVMFRVMARLGLDFFRILPTVHHSISQNTDSYNVNRA